MDQFNNYPMPAIRSEAHFGDRVVRCFAERPPSFHAMFEAAVARRGDHEAMVFEGRRWTYRTLDAMVAEHVRTVAQADWQTVAGGWHTFQIQADAFLFRMVRSLVGALKRVGQGELTVAEFAALLASADRAQCPPPAPPQGL